MRYGFVIDQRKCIGCHACTVACKERERRPARACSARGSSTSRRASSRTPGATSACMRCNHCDNAPCVTICPTVALYQRGPTASSTSTATAASAASRACRPAPTTRSTSIPRRNTAAKCHYCAHRVEIGLEPACVVVCPEQAIVAGRPRRSAQHDLAAGRRAADAGAQAGAGDAAQALLHRRGRRRAHAGHAGAPQRVRVLAGRPHPERRPADRPAAPAIARASSTATAATARHGSARAGAHRLRRRAPARRGAGRSRAYLWTKSIARGRVAGRRAAASRLGLPTADALRRVAAPVLALVFLLADQPAAGLRPEAPGALPLSVLQAATRRSWLVWGAWILFAARAARRPLAARGLTATCWRCSCWPGPPPLVAAATAGYSAFLFGQAEGRDFWQSPLLLPHLLVAALWPARRACSSPPTSLGSASMHAPAASALVLGARCW